MTEINNGSIHAFLKASAPGPFMIAEIVSLTGFGKLKIACNKLSSTLYCNYLEEGAFEWKFNKVDDEHISLSPVNSCIGPVTYASIRDDNNYYLQVQAPHSNDWITAVARDEIINFKLHDLNIAEFKGFNGKYIQVNPQPDYVPALRFSGWRLRSMGDSFDQRSRWLIKVKSSLQANIRFSGALNDRPALETQLSHCNIALDEEAMTRISQQVL